MVFALQKASLWKRISAFLFDGILFCVVAVLFAYLVSAVIGYDARGAERDQYYDTYSREYGVNLLLTSDEYDALSDEEKNLYSEAREALLQDPDFERANSLALEMTLLIITFGLLIAYLVMEFALPLVFGNGQTLGKKLFSLGLMRTDGVKVKPVALFVRAILGKFTMETMLPLLMLLLTLLGGSTGLGLILVAAILLGNLCLLLFTRTHAPLHDLMAYTVVIDLPSQMIFDTPEAMIAYKEKINAERAANEMY